MNQAGFAAHRGVSRKTITHWKHRGLLVFRPDGNVDVAATDRALLDHGISLPSEPKTVTHPGSSELSDDLDQLWTTAQAEMVKENYLALLKRLQYQRRCLQVVTVDDAAGHIQDEFNLVRTRLSTVSASLAPRLAKLRSAEEIKALVDAAMHDALLELSTLDDAPTHFLEHR
jgi:hypothetical protein